MQNVAATDRAEQIRVRSIVRHRTLNKKCQERSDSYTLMLLSSVAYYPSGVNPTSLMDRNLASRVHSRRNPLKVRGQHEQIIRIYKIHKVIYNLCSCFTILIRG